MSTFYLSIRSAQSPFDLGSDDLDRSVIVCNYDAVARSPVDKFEEEIARLLYDQSLGVVGTDVFIGSRANVPDGGLGPWVHIIRTPSYFPLETHNGNKYERLSCQITVRSNNYQIARARAIAIWGALDGVINTTVTAA